MVFKTVVRVSVTYTYQLMFSPSLIYFSLAHPKWNRKKFQRFPEKNNGFGKHGLYIFSGFSNPYYFGFCFTYLFLFEGLNLIKIKVLLLGHNRHFLGFF